LRKAAAELSRTEQMWNINEVPNDRMCSLFRDKSANTKVCHVEIFFVVLLSSIDGH